MLPADVERLAGLEHDALTDAEHAAVLEAAEGHRLEALFRVALGTGLREGEICGLRWSDVDLDAGTLSVRQTVQRETGAGLVMDRPKTAASRRTIPLSASVLDVLRGLPRGAMSAPLFPSTAGTHLDPTNVNHEWQKVCEAAGIGKRRFHATRHTYAVRYLKAGGDIYSLSSLLGHASIKITADTYADAIADAKRAGVVAIAV
ncbi:MAG: site-specific integrase [Acidimicrobiaceae bacterium]|nr:site-specific integrase [Acidimicrobiaceae bacterium]